jgi:hypothetical protein
VSEDRGDRIVEHLALAGIKSLPLGELALAMVGEFVGDPNGDFRTALQQEVLADVLELKNRVARLGERLDEQGNALDELGTLRSSRVFQEFLAAWKDARGDEKREALMNAAARQFDPTTGGRAFRERIFRMFADMPDAHVAGLRAFGGATNGLYFYRSEWTISRGSGEKVRKVADDRAKPYGLEKLDLSEDEVSVMSEVLDELWQRGLIKGLIRGNETDRAGRSEWFLLNPIGKALYRAMDL